MMKLELLIVIVNLVISLLYIRTRNKKIIMIFIETISFIGFCFGYLLVNAFIMDAIYPNKQIYLGNLIMIIFLTLQLLIFIKIIIDIIKNKKEGGKT